MKLYWSSRSPFARKVTVVAHERGLIDRIELIATLVSKTEPNLALTPLNPLGQIPTLVLDDGSIIHDSLVICEFLDTQGPCDAALLPYGAGERWQALRRHSLGQGMTDALIAQFSERKRLQDPLQPTYVKASQEKFRRVAAALEQECASWKERPIDLGDIAIACALAYADFRFQEESWRVGRPELTGWYDAFALRPSMIATQFAA